MPYRHPLIGREKKNVTLTLDWFFFFFSFYINMIKVQLMMSTLWLWYFYHYAQETNWFLVYKQVQIPDILFDNRRLYQLS